MLAILILFVIVGVVIFNSGLRQSIVQSSTVVQIEIDYNTDGVTIPVGKNSIIVSFDPIYATGSIPSVRAWEIVVHRDEWGTLKEYDTQTGKIDDKTTKTTISIDVDFDKVARYTVTAFVLIYDKYLDYLQDDSSPPPTVYTTKALPLSIVSPASGERVYYDKVSVTVSTYGTSDTSSEFGEYTTDFNFLPILLLIPILIKLKHRKDE